MRLFLNGLCCLFAFINVGIAVWLHDMNGIVSWSSATFGWFLATMYVYEMED